jgi:hypothetical protein
MLVSLTKQLRRNVDIVTTSVSNLVRDNHHLTNHQGDRLKTACEGKNDNCHNPTNKLLGLGVTPACIKNSSSSDSAWLSRRRRFVAQSHDQAQEVSPSAYCDFN